MQGKKGKTEKRRIENHATKVTKIQKTKRWKYGMNKTLVTLTKKKRKMEWIRHKSRKTLRRIPWYGNDQNFGKSARFNKNLIFSEEQLCHLVADLFGAGLDTTLTTLKWALLYLASYPETQEIILTEIGKLNEQEFFLSESDLPQTTVSKIY